jgi:hypothetical protein
LNHFDTMKVSEGIQEGVKIAVARAFVLGGK